MANLSITVIDGNNISVAVAARATQTVTIDRSVSGPTGPIGLVWKGAWSGATSYILNDGVSFGGSSYICILANTNNTPPNGTYWNLLAQNGSVTSVGLSAPAIFTVSGSPVTSTGTLALSYSGTALPVPNGGTGLTSLTAGYVPFGAGTSALNSSSNLFWDNTNTRLGVGTASPAFTLDVNGTVNALLSTGYRATTLDRPNVRPSLLLDFADTRLLDPRITFTRASTATFYDQTTSALAEQNVIPWSQQFTISPWGTTLATVADNNTTAPDGTTTAAICTATASTGGHNIANSSVLTSGVTYLVSIYVKAGTYNYVGIGINNGLGAVSYNLATQTLLTGTGTITSVGSGWYRITTSLAPGGSRGIGIGFVDASGNATLTTVGTETFYLWGVQAEVRASVTAYTPTTTAAITNYIPVLQTAASGAARFDCNPTTRESLGLLIEESRTNLIINGECSGSNALPTGWNIDQAFGGITPVNYINNSYGGYGSFNFSIYGTTTGANRFLLSPTTARIAVSANTTYTFSYNCKVANGIYAYTITPTFLWYDTGGSMLSGSTGTVITPTSTSTRYVTTVTSPASTATLLIRFDFTGFGSSGITLGFTMQFGGVQLEAGSFATSYIPTVASQVTRAADAASMTGTNFSSWYNIAEGSVYSEVVAPNKSGNKTAVNFSDSSTNGEVQRIQLRLENSSGIGGFICTAAGVIQANLTNGTYSATSTRLAGVYKTNAFALSSNGAAATTSSSGSAVPSPIELRIGNKGTSTNEPLNGSIKRITYYPVALTSTQLQALTS